MLNGGEFRKAIIPADAIARAIGFAIEQPADVDVSEIVAQPVGRIHLIGLNVAA